MGLMQGMAWRGVQEVELCYEVDVELGGLIKACLICIFTLR